MYPVITVLIISICALTPCHAGNSTILFSQKKGVDRGWSIYRVNPDSSGKDILIPFHSGQGEYNPAISPDGTSVLFNTYRYGGWKLASFDIKKNTIYKLKQGSAYYVNGVFSPDGEQIAYEKSMRGSTHIYVANKNGTNEIRLTRALGHENRSPSWTPDGRHIVFFAKNKDTHDIYRINLATKAIKNMTNNVKGNDFNPSVSPDG